MVVVKEWIQFSEKTGYESFEIDREGRVRISFSIMSETLTLNVVTYRQRVEILKYLLVIR